MNRAKNNSGAISGGFPSPAEHFSSSPLSLDDYLVKRPAATFFVRMEGEAMSAKGIYSGDVLVVERTISPASGDLVVAIVEDECIVRIFRLAHGETRLEAADPKIPAIVLPPNAPVRLFGKVTAVVRKL